MVLENWLVKVKQEDANTMVQLNLNSTIQNNNYFAYKERNLLIKEWKAAGIFKLKDNNEMMSLNEIEPKTGTSSSRQFEYNAVKSAFERTRSTGTLTVANEE